MRAPGQAATLRVRRAPVVKNSQHFSAMNKAIGAEAESGFNGKMPDVIHALLADIAEIRNIILLNAPSCLPQVAPALIDAEDQVKILWQN